MKNVGLRSAAPIFLLLNSPFCILTFLSFFLLPSTILVLTSFGFEEHGMMNNEVRTAASRDAPGTMTDNKKTYFC